MEKTLSIHESSLSTHGKPGCLFLWVFLFFRFGGALLLLLEAINTLSPQRLALLRTVVEGFAASTNLGVELLDEFEAVLALCLARCRVIRALPKSLPDSCALRLGDVKPAKSVGDRSLIALPTTLDVRAGWLGRCVFRLLCLVGFNAANAEGNLAGGRVGASIDLVVLALLSLCGVVRVNALLAEGLSLNRGVLAVLVLAHCRVFLGCIYNLDLPDSIFVESWPLG